MALVKELFREQVRKNLEERKETLLKRSAFNTKQLIAAIDAELSKPIKLPGEVRGHYKRYLDQEAQSEIIKTSVTIFMPRTYSRGKWVSNNYDVTGYAIQIDGPDKYIVMYRDEYGKIAFDTTPVLNPPPSI